MQTSFRITPAELTTEWLENLKQLFTSQQEVEITIKDVSSTKGYPSISFEEACQKVSNASKEYDNGITLLNPEDVLKQVIS
jgi:hypothetical protein